MSTYKLEVLLGVNVGAVMFTTLLLVWPGSFVLQTLIMLALGFNIGAIHRALAERRAP